jgi:hypothetical protein
VVFIEQALRIANKEGRVGFIVPNKFIGNDYGGPLRKLLASGRHLIDLVDFRHLQVFENVSTYTSRPRLPSRRIWTGPRRAST